jgi:hypothetical protein
MAKRSKMAEAVARRNAAKKAAGLARATGAEEAEMLSIMQRAGAEGIDPAQAIRDFNLNRRSRPGTQLATVERAGRRMEYGPSGEPLITPQTDLAVRPGETGMSRTVASTEVAAGETLVDKISRGLKSKGARYTAAYFALQSLIGDARNVADELLRSKAEQGQIDLANMQASPENAVNQAMMPITQAQKQAALYMLLQKMGGRGGRAPMLADGEVLT